MINREGESQCNECGTVYTGSASAADRVKFNQHEANRLLSAEISGEPSDRVNFSVSAFDLATFKSTVVDLPSQNSVEYSVEASMIHSFPVTNEGLNSRVKALEDKLDFLIKKLGGAA